MPEAAISTIRARSRVRPSLFRDLPSASSARRSSIVKAIVVAWAIAFIPTTNHDSRFSDSGY
jgi:hypothetical protein